MNAMWLSAIATFLLGGTMWFLDLSESANTFGTLPRYVGTLLPVSFIAFDLGRKYLPVRVSLYVRVGLAVLNGIVLLSVITVNSIDASASVLLTAAMAAVWGTVFLNILLLTILIGLGFGMARNYMRVASGRYKGIGSTMVSLGGVSMLLPLFAFPMYADWPLISLPALVVAVAGKRLLGDS